jgi:hypothetical protein
LHKCEVVLKIQTEEKFLGSDIILPMQSLQSLLDTRCGTNGRNPEDGKAFTILAIVQQVLKVAPSPPARERGTG